MAKLITARQAMVVAARVLDGRGQAPDDFLDARCVLAAAAQIAALSELTKQVGEKSYRAFQDSRFPVPDYFLESFAPEITDWEEA
jgi:hypothetical protein